jgi:hypothetical protein
MLFLVFEKRTQNLVYITPQQSRQSGKAGNRRKARHHGEYHSTQVLQGSHARVWSHNVILIIRRLTVEMQLNCALPSHERNVYHCVRVLA